MSGDLAKDPPAVETMAPIVPVRNVPLSVRFYTETLGFELEALNAGETSALVRRGPAGLMLMQLGDLRALRATDEYFSAYIWVRGVERLWDELAPRLARYSSEKVRAPYTRGDGVVEFLVRDPDGFLIFFGEPQSG